MSLKRLNVEKNTVYIYPIFIFPKSTFSKISTFSLRQKECAYYGKSAYYECAYYE